VPVLCELICGGTDARTITGVTALPLNLPVVRSAEVEIATL
jgi:hypothetical protein